MKTTLAALSFAVTAASAMAQSTPVGLWRNVDDKTGEVKAEMSIAETGGG